LPGDEAVTRLRFGFPSPARLGPPLRQRSIRRGITADPIACDGYDGYDEYDEVLAKCPVVQELALTT
jgi:hypothetical protein